MLFMEEMASHQEQRVLEKFNSALRGSSFEVGYFSNSQWSYEKDKHNNYPDLVIYKFGRVFAFVEVKGMGYLASRSNYGLLLKQSKEKLPKDLSESNFILTDGESFLFEGFNDLEEAKGRKKIKGKEVLMSFNLFISFLLGEEPLRYKRLRDYEFLHLFWERVQSCSEMHPDLRKWWEELDKNDSFEENGMSVRFSSVEIENQFFLSLLGMVKDDELCRYTKLDSLFILLRDKKQNMLSLVCMNDKGELSYVDKKVSLPYTPIPDEPNNCFILSLLPASHHDELTFWRLYGDDASGTCLTYEVKPEVNTKAFPGFYLAKVSYERDGCHPELEFINDLVNKLSYHGKVFTFWNWHIWKHFFKSKHFNIEDEVRLLFIAEKGQKPESMWVKNESNMIVSKMVLIPLSPWAKRSKIKFPLRLSSIMIGPKITEPDVIDQYDYMRKSNLKTIKSVNPSTIVDVYR